MNATHKIDQEQRVIYSVWSGAATQAEIVAATNALLSDPNFNPHYDRVYDVREVTEASLTKAGLMELSQIDPIYPSERRAVVATNPRISGIGRMYGLLTGTEENGRFRVVSDLQQALDWFKEPR